MGLAQKQRIATISSVMSFRPSCTEEIGSHIKDFSKIMIFQDFSKNLSRKLKFY